MVTTASTNEFRSAAAQVGSAGQSAVRRFVDSPDAAHLRTRGAHPASTLVSPLMAA
jgi:hypothetical protein